ncbi:hypothetical protein [Nocardioides conyzicola]|uniref:DUF305 domain-containing protein n=1 Tax=Nocardioides conyzicola TaxID=1651781 RepID=A0ABP8WWF0_9ACTN
MNTHSLPHRTSRPVRRAAVVGGVVLAVALSGLVAPTTSAADSPRRATPPTTSSRAAAAATPLSRATAALTLALAELHKGHPGKAAAAFNALARRTDRAHAAAVGLIGKPPADPESDEPPGPGAVLKMLGFDHKVTTTLVPLLNRQKGTRVVRSMANALNRTHVRRNGMISRVVALPPEGAGDDYTDGMSDILGTFPAEIKLIDTALSTYVLTTAGRSSLTSTRARVVVANRLMNGAYGGGE